MIKRVVIYPESGYYDYCSIIIVMDDDVVYKHRKCDMTLENAKKLQEAIQKKNEINTEHWVELEF